MSSDSDDDNTDDELPTSSVAELTLDPSDRGPDDEDDDGDDDDRPLSNATLRSRRAATHAKLRAYEAQRRAAYASKLASSALYWHAFRTLLHDSLRESRKADLLARGWTSATATAARHLGSVGEWCIDEKDGAPVTDAKRKKRLRERAGERVGGGAAAGPAPPGDGGGGAAAAARFPAGGRGAFDPLGDFFREEQCGAMIQRLAEAAGDVARQHEEFATYMGEEVLPGLAALVDHLKTELTFMEKLGDSIINELETAEDAVCKAWESYYNRTLDFSASTPEAIQERLTGAHEDGSITLDFNTAVVGCADVWVEEMKYRMAVAFLSSVWEKCSSELSKLFLSMKDAECGRRSQLRELMISTAQRQESLWQGLPAAITPVLTEFVEWPMERKVVEDDVQWSIRERAQTIQLEEAENKRPGDAATPSPPGLAGAEEGDGNFELSSPLVSDLICKAKVVEKRSPGMMSAWKVSVAIVTSDSFLQLFELPSACKLTSGSAPEVAFQNLIPPVVVPNMEGVKAGVKFPSAKHWFDDLVPSESFALPNCTVAMRDEEKYPNSFEIVEMRIAGGASKMFTKTLNRKMQFRAITREEAIDFVDELKRSKI